MKAMVIRDHRPGHFRQSDGVVLALRRRGPVSVSLTALPRQRWLRGRFRRWLALSFSFRPDMALKMFYGIAVDDLPEPDLIISAGADTMVANILLSRHFSAPNIFIGSLRDTPPDAFAAVLAIDPDEAKRPRHIRVLKPVAFDPDTLRQPRPLAGPDDLAGARAALLIGGPSSSHAWSNADWQELIRLIEAGIERGISWQVASSPRTPPGVADRFAEFAAHHDSIAFTDFREAGPGSADALFEADFLLVTADSASMVMEAVSARRPVVALSPGQTRPSRDDGALSDLARRRLIATMRLGQTAFPALAEAVFALRPLTENPLDDLAQKITGIMPANRGEMPGTDNAEPGHSG